jgi:hypothetical protein
LPKPQASAEGEAEVIQNKTPTSKKSQSPNPNSTRDLGALELETWSFSGVWNLVFGVRSADSSTNIQ